MNHANGRVNILGYNPYARFLMHDKIPTQQKDTEYREALTGNWQDNTLSTTFFSAANIRIIQNGIKAGVYKKSNGRFKIGDQDESVLKIIMRSVYLSNAANLPDNIPQQVGALNKIVLDYSVPQVFNEAESYIKYKNDVSTLAVPIQNPLPTRRWNVLEMKPWF